MLAGKLFFISVFESERVGVDWGDDWRVGEEEVDEEEVDGVADLVPGGLELSEEFEAERGDGVVFARGALEGFFPAVGEESVIFEAGQERVEGTFHYDEVRFLEACDHLGGVGVASAEDEKYAELKHSFAHLGFQVVDVHDYQWFSSGEATGNASRMLQR